jgi:hypothetical protein
MWNAGKSGTITQAKQQIYNLELRSEPLTQNNECLFPAFLNSISIPFPIFPPNEPAV